MSAESSLVFYGIRYEVPESELQALESNRHPLIQKARAHGLQFYAGNFAEPDEKYFLFVGKKLGVIGAENASELIVPDDTLQALISDTKQRLADGGIGGAPQLYVQWMPDA